MAAEFVNLSNGLSHWPLCPNGQGRGGWSDRHVIRLQSTHCEQKQWERILVTLGPEFYYALATESHVLVHDESEKRREPHAMWQGLVWVRFACELAWHGRARPALVTPRGGHLTHDASAYFTEQWAGLDRTTRNMVRWYGQYLTNGGPVLVRSCEREGWK